MECRRCGRQVDGTLYAHWERECHTCQAFMRLEEDNRRLQQEKDKPVVSAGGWPVEDAKSIAEIENTELREELAAIATERDQLRAEVGRLRGEAAKQFELWQRTTARAEAAEAHAADLRAALEELVAAAQCIRHWHDAGRNGDGMIVSSAKVHELWAETEIAQAVLARTPAQSLARCKAEALDGAWQSIAALETVPAEDLRDRHINEGIRQALDVVFELQQIQLDALADRLEKGAANGKA